MIPNTTVAEVLKNKGQAVYAVAPSISVYHAIEQMAQRNIGALMVVENDRLIGIISERDYTRKIVLKGKTSRETLVGEILSGPVIHVAPSHTVEECMRLMTENRIRHLPVLDGLKIIGLVSIGDLVNWIISTQSNTIQQLQTYISGYPSTEK